MELQPVETAPRDGRRFLTYMVPARDGEGPMYDFAQWFDDIEDFVQDGCGWQFVTHWCDLPVPTA